MIKSTKKYLLESTMLIGALSVAMSAPAFAQSDEIIVTGSRIAKKDFTANSPVVTLGEDQFDLTATVNTEGLLNTLPQVVPCLLYTSPSPRDATLSRMPSSA